MMFSGMGDGPDCSTVKALQAAGVPAPTDAASLQVWNQCVLPAPPAPAMDCTTIRALNAAGVPPPTVGRTFVGGIPIPNSQDLIALDRWVSCTGFPVAPPVTPAPQAPAPPPPPAPPAPTPPPPAPPPGGTLAPASGACRFWEIWESPSTTAPGKCGPNLLLLGGAAAAAVLLLMMGGKR